MKIEPSLTHGPEPRDVVSRKAALACAVLLSCATPAFAAQEGVRILDDFSDASAWRVVTSNQVSGTLRAADGVDGKAIYLYGEGWNFGEVADDARFVQATQARSMSILATGRCAAHSHAAKGDAELRRRDVSAAKYYVGKAARFVGQQAVQLHGGMGMADELAVSHYFKRLTMIDMTFGDSLHHLAAVSDAILREPREAE